MNHKEVHGWNLPLFVNQFGIFQHSLQAGKDFIKPAKITGQAWSQGGVAQMMAAVGCLPSYL